MVSEEKPKDPGTYAYGEDYMDEKTNLDEDYRTGRIINDSREAEQTTGENFVRPEVGRDTAERERETERDVAAEEKILDNLIDRGDDDEEEEEDNYEQVDYKPERK